VVCDEMWSGADDEEGRVPVEQVRVSAFVGHVEG
jgi:hypothetical protein